MRAVSVLPGFCPTSHDSSAVGVGRAATRYVSSLSRGQLRPRDRPARVEPEQAQHPLLVELRAAATELALQPDDLDPAARLLGLRADLPLGAHLAGPHHLVLVEQEDRTFGRRRSVPRPAVWRPPARRPRVYRLVCVSRMRCASSQISMSSVFGSAPMKLLKYLNSDCARALRAPRDLAHRLGERLGAGRVHARDRDATACPSRLSAITLLPEPGPPSTMTTVLVFSRRPAATACSTNWKATCCWSSRTNRSRFSTSVAATASSCRDGSVGPATGPRPTAVPRRRTTPGPVTVAARRSATRAHRGCRAGRTRRAVVAELPALRGRVVQVRDAVHAGVARRRGRA